MYVGCWNGLVQIKRWHIQVTTGFAVLAIPIFLLLHMYYQDTATMDFPFVPMTTIPQVILNFIGTFDTSMFYYFIMFILSLAGITLVTNGIYNRYASRLTLESASQIRRKLVIIGRVFVSSFVGAVLLILAAMAYDSSLAQGYGCTISDNCETLVSKELYHATMYIAIFAAIMCGIAACMAIIHFRSNNALDNSPKAIK
jgi:hypothetical protein